LDFIDRSMPEAAENHARMKVLLQFFFLPWIQSLFVRAAYTTRYSVPLSSAKAAFFRPHSWYIKRKPAIFKGL
jgi:hypothetical protein